MPRQGSEKRPVFNVEARNKDELKKWKKAAEERGFSQTEMGALAIRQYLEGDVSDPKEVDALKQRIEELDELLTEARARVTTLDRANFAVNEELVQVRERFYGDSAEVIDLKLVQLFHSTLVSEKSISRKEFISRIPDAISRPDLVDQLRHLEMLFVSVGMLDVSKGVLTWKMD